MHYHWSCTPSGQRRRFKKVNGIFSKGLHIHYSLNQKQVTRVTKQIEKASQPRKCHTDLEEDRTGCHNRRREMKGKQKAKQMPGEREQEQDEEESELEAEEEEVDMLDDLDLEEEEELFANLSA